MNRGQRGFHARLWPIMALALVGIVVLRLNAKHRLAEAKAEAEAAAEAR